VCGFRVLASFVFLLSLWQGVSHTCVVHLESVHYSRLARLATIHGDVRVQLKVAADGRVLSANAHSGHSILRRDAEENAKKWLFNHGGERNPEIVYQFRLEEPAVNYEPGCRTSFDLPNRVLVVSNLAKPSH